jgi:predicted CoA-binding protein
LGVPCVSSLAEIDQPVDIVDVFRRSVAAATVAAEAAAVGAPALWLQLGVRSDEARRVATEAGMAYVENPCIKTVLLGGQGDSHDRPGRHLALP